MSVNLTFDCPANEISRQLSRLGSFVASLEGVAEDARTRRFPSPSFGESGSVDEKQGTPDTIGFQFVICDEQSLPSGLACESPAKEWPEEEIIRRCGGSFLRLPALVERYVQGESFPPRNSRGHPSLGPPSHPSALGSVSGNWRGPRLGEVIEILFRLANG